MGTEQETTDHETPSERYLPPPVPGGTEELESLGRWIDNLFGHERIRRRIQAELSRHYLREDEMPPDAPPEKAPPPVTA